MNILVIITYDDDSHDYKKLWKSIKEKFFPDSDSSSHIHDLSTDKRLIIVRQPDDTTPNDIIQKIINNLNNVIIKELCIATHIELDINEIASLLDIDHSLIKQCPFHHTANTEPYDNIHILISSLCADKLIQEDLCNNFDDLWKYIYKNISLNHLIALSILCQGYLAAHDVEGFKVTDIELQNRAIENCRKTEGRKWWEPVLDDAINEGKAVEKGKIYEELKVVNESNKDNVKITKLVNTIKDDELKRNDSNIKAFTNIVIEAYGQLTKVL